MESKCKLILFNTTFNGGEVFLLTNRAVGYEITELVSHFNKGKKYLMTLLIFATSEMFHKSSGFEEGKL